MANMAPSSWLKWGWWNRWPGFAHKEFGAQSWASGSSLLPCVEPLQGESWASALSHLKGAVIGGKSPSLAFGLRLSLSGDSFVA